MHLRVFLYVCLVCTFLCIFVCVNARFCECEYARTQSISIDNRFNLVKEDLDIELMIKDSYLKMFELRSTFSVSKLLRFQVNQES